MSLFWKWTSKGTDEYRAYCVIAWPFLLCFSVSTFLLNQRLRAVIIALLICFTFTGFLFSMLFVFALPVLGALIKPFEIRTLQGLLALAAFGMLVVNHYFLLVALLDRWGELHVQGEQVRQGFPVVFPTSPDPDLTPHDRSQR